MFLAYLDDLIVQLKTDDKKTHLRRRGLGYVDIIDTVILLLTNLEIAIYYEPTELKTAIFIISYKCY
jgi:hypothetical protein